MNWQECVITSDVFSVLNIEVNDYCSQKYCCAPQGLIFLNRKHFFEHQSAEKLQGGPSRLENVFS